MQVLNEFAAVSRRKQRRDWREIDEAVADVLTTADPPLAITLDLHISARALAEDHLLSFYDALIVASAIEAGCDTLYSEDMQHGRAIGGVAIVNPFFESAPGAPGFRKSEISLDVSRKSPSYPSPSCPTEGRIRIVRDAGRDAVDAAASGVKNGGRAASQGVRERSDGALTNGAVAYGEVVWS